MDSASDRSPQDHRLSVANLLPTPFSHAEFDDKMKNSETEAHLKDPLTQTSENSANQEDGVDENETLNDENTGFAAIDDERSSSGEESITGEKEQLMVKLKYKTKTTTTFRSEHRDPADTSSLSSNLSGTLGGISNSSSGNIGMKLKTEDHRNTPSQSPAAIDPQTNREENVEDDALMPKPLSRPEENPGRVNIIKDEPDHDVHQQVDASNKGLVGDEMDVDVQPGDDAAHVPVNDDICNKSSDAVGAQTAASKPDKVQESLAIEERRVDTVDSGYQQGEDVSLETTHGISAVFEEDLHMSDGFDLNEWASNGMDRPEADVPAIDHQVASSDFADNGMNVPQADHQVKQFPHGFHTGQPGLDAQGVWIQPHPDFSDPVHFNNKSSSPHYRNPPVLTPAVTSKGFTQHQTPPPRHVAQQPFDQSNEPNFGPGFDRQQQLQAQVEQKKKQLENFKKLHEERRQQFQQLPHEFNYPRSQLNAPPPFVTGPLTYQRSPQTGYQQLSHKQDSSGFQQPSLPTMSYTPIPQYDSYGFDPVSLYKRTVKAPVPHTTNNRMPEPNVSLGFQKARKQVSDEHDCGDEGDASDDDEPLRTRVKRHPSVTSSRDSVIGMSPPSMTSNRVPRDEQQDDDSNVESVANKGKPKHTIPKIAQNPVRMSHPAYQPGSSSPTPPKNASQSPSPNEQIDWTLPQYEIQRQPLAKGEEIPSAKVSLPGLVCEEILLSPDHADEEVHLLMNIFIPAQRALPTPDPEPAIALLNFHTIAAMVIEAYVQYEIGDEFGTGRGHFHSEHDRSDAEYQRVRNAVDADTNEIFFAVVDRYRAGLESKKKSLQLIRGTQEFCEVALDVVHYIKEHGLLRPEVKVRAVRADKGVKRGPRGGVAVGEKGKGKGVKRGTVAMPNEVLPRKKAKTTAASVVEVKKKRSKPKTPGVTVMRR